MRLFFLLIVRIRRVSATKKTRSAGRQGSNTFKSQTRNNLICILHSLAPFPQTPLPSLAHRTEKGFLSPLPPIEELQKLRDLITDDKSSKENGDQSAQIYWSFLRRKVLIPLAAVIGADGRGGSGGMGGRAAALRHVRYSSVQVGVESWNSVTLLVHRCSEWDVFIHVPLLFTP